VKSLSRIFKAIFVSGLVLIASSTFAASKGTLELKEATNVAGKALQTGRYNVTWQGTGDQVELNIYKGKQLVTSIPATVIQLSSSPENDSAVVDRSSDGTRTLSQIRFGGKKFALQIANEGGGSSSGGSAK
jgi:hypothetical protein